MLKEKIISLYYKEHLKTKEISQKLNVSPAYITKVVKKDGRYHSEKQYRKECSQYKRKIEQNRFAKNKRDKQKIEDNYQAIKTQHDKASIELSKSKHLSDENYRKWNYSAYTYSPSKRRYEFDERLGRAADVPKYVKERY